MQLEATYNRGQLKFNTPIQFNREQFTLLVTVPDQEIATPTVDASAPQQSCLQDRLDAIIGKAFRQANRGKPTINAKALWHQHLEEKYLGR